VGVDGGFFVFLLLVLVVCGLIASGIASEKNRSGGGFFLIGFFFGPLGILVAALIGREKPKTPAGMRAVVCPRCNAEQNVDAHQPSFECWQCKLVSPVS
jgi:hypothetical protein